MATHEDFSPEDLRRALAGVGIGVWAWDIERDIVTWSLQTGEIFGVAPDDFPVNLAGFLKLVENADQQTLHELVDSALAHGGSEYSAEYRVAGLKPERWIRDLGRIERADDGTPIRISGAVQDVTAMRRAAKGLKESAEQLRIFSELASDYVYVVDMNAPTLVPSIVAGSFERVTGYTLDEVAAIGGWTKIMHPDDLTASAELMIQMERGVPFVNEYRITAKSGEIRWLRDRVRPVLENGKLARLVGGVQDITERKHLQDQLRHAQKMDALARIAGGVAHDFNNILMVVSASAELLRERFPDDRAALKLIGEVELACQHGVQLTGSLLTFGRRSPGTPRAVALDEVLRSAEPLLSRAVGGLVKVVLNIGPTEIVEIDPSQLQLVLLNMALNARDAMPAGGRLTISCAVDEHSRARAPEVRADRCAVLTVEDTGHGMEPDVLARLFEPFFTTKAARQGNGLGLASCHGIVNQSGGAIRVESEPGQGTRFVIYLPTMAPGPTTAAPVATAASIGGTESLLLVEDEPAVREVMTRVLAGFGYVVRDVGTLSEARSTFASGEFQVLISDIRLPDGSGLDLAIELCARKPQLSVLLVSAFAEEGVHTAIREHRFVFLPKPFASEALARSIREALRPREPFV